MKITRLAKVLKRGWRLTLEHTDRGCEATLSRWAMTGGNDAEYQDECVIDRSVSKAVDAVVERVCNPEKYGDAST